MRRFLYKCVYFFAKGNGLLYAIAILLVGLIISPFTFTQTYWFSNIDFTNTGQIGDTIGGLTAPVIGLINAFLLFLTLKRQSEQEQLGRLETSFDRITSTIDGNIRQLSITFKQKQNLEAMSFPAASYQGTSAVGTSTILFKHKTNLNRCEINVAEWLELVENMKQILLMASFLLDRNSRYDQNFIERNIRYLYVKSQISAIERFVSNVKDFDDKYPTAKQEYKEFAISFILTLVQSVDMIESLKPINN